MLERGEVVRLPHGRGNGIVVDCSLDGHVLVYIGGRRVFVGSPIEPIIEEYLECELIPTGERVAQVARRPPRRQLANV